MTANQHHPAVECKTVQINGTSIPAGVYTYRIALSQANHKIVRAILRGYGAVDVTGYEGAFALGTNTAGQSTGFSIKPIVLAGYTTSYMGGYSRLHGDAYISEFCFGTSIVLQDLYIDGTDVVLLFRNYSGINQSLYCYGTLAVK